MKISLPNVSINKPPPQKTSNKWPNDASVYCDSMYIDNTDKHIRVQRPISHPLASASHSLLATSAEKHAPKSSSTRMQKTWDSAPNITSPCIRKSLSPWHLSNRLINPDALLWALDQSPKQHHLSIIKSYPTLKTTGLTILHTPAFKTTGSPPPLLQQQHPKCPSSGTEKSGLISSSTSV